MWIEKTKEEIMKMEKNKEVSQIALWDDLSKAKKFYEKENRNYMGYKIDNPTHAFSTPYKVLTIIR